MASRDEDEFLWYEEHHLEDYDGEDYDDSDEGGFDDLDDLLDEALDLEDEDAEP